MIVGSEDFELSTPTQNERRPVTRTYSESSVYSLKSTTSGKSLKSMYSAKSFDSITDFHSVCSVESFQSIPRK